MCKLLNNFATRISDLLFFEIEIFLFTTKNKTEMKAIKFFMLALSFVLMSATCDARETTISVNKLPKAAQNMIANNFKGKKVTRVKKDVEANFVDFDVVLNDGTKLEFDNNGQWTEVDCKPSTVPAAVVPAAIAKYVKAQYPNARIVQIERDSRGYEIDLSNGLDISFDKQFNVVKTDD